jgi:hypothetical protein
MIGCGVNHSRQLPKLNLKTEIFALAREPIIAIKQTMLPTD